MAGQGGKSRKCGRNKIKCARYKSEGRREKNKARKAAKNNKIHLKGKAYKDKYKKENQVA